MTKRQFYSGKTIQAVEWWLHEPDLPTCAWARLRVFSDGTADACFNEGETLYGFDDRRYASNFLAEDEFRSLAGLDAEDEAEFGFRLAELQPPVWREPEPQSFKYLGTY